MPIHHGKKLHEVILRAYGSENRDPMAAVGCRTGASLRRMTAKHLERLGDMACNVAEEVIYMVEGEIVRHADFA
ncbi:MAG TPA: hypothetical protein VGX78_06415 [Pirellulales bacterium]|nr:hypothetical protein [Pirellulales bacterium]